ncbi:MAG TPA: hypothetical protein DHV48_01035 [Prolixibacteraceae bacterium]|nr:hypothetical protein [Prolixibacteraceae bacterium]
MLTIEVKYRPVSWLPFSGKAESKVPQNWGDVSQKQLIAIACLYKSAISDIDFLKSMSGLKKNILNKLSDFELYKLMEIFEFVADQKPYHEFIIQKLSVSRYPVLYAPSPKLKGVTFGQFIFADTYFANYQQSNYEDDLNKFIASLYLGKNEKFEERLIQERFLCIGKLDMNIRQAIVMNYQLIHEWLALAYPLIFQKREEMSNDDGTDRKRPVSDQSPWIKVFQNFVGDDILHDEAWAAKPVNTIFAYMTRKYKENARKH